MGLKRMLHSYAEEGALVLNHALTVQALACACGKYVTYRELALSPSYLLRSNAPLQRAPPLDSDLTTPPHPLQAVEICGNVAGSRR